MRIIFFLLSPLLLFSETGLLKDSKKELLEIQRKEMNSKGDLIKNLWWGQLNLEGSYNWSDSKGKTDEFPNFTATISQDIFRSGGIYWQIRKGKLYKNLNQTLLDKKEQDLVFNLYKLVLNINKLDIGIEKQRLTITNQNILIKNLKDKYINGVIDISILDESIIQLNSLKNGEEGIIQTRIDLIANLRDITNLDYTQINIPKFETFSIQEFLEKNIDLNVQTQLIEQMRVDKNLAYSNYLPRVSLYGSYQYEDSDNFQNEKDSHRYGVKISIPIGFNMGGAFETAQATYLRSKSELTDKQENQKNIYSRIISKLESIDRRVKNSEELIESYLSIYEITKEYYESDLKTEDDVTILKNRVDISKFDLDIYNIDKKITKLLLYQAVFR